MIDVPQIQSRIESGNPTAAEQLLPLVDDERRVRPRSRSAMTIDRNSRILILGAGAGGLSAAYFLGQYGYKNVTVFEKLGRVGGLCRSVTEDNQSFDLGAAVISPDYREVRRMARRVGARLERVEGAAALSVSTAILIRIRSGSLSSAFALSGGGRFTLVALAFLPAVLALFLETILATKDVQESRLGGDCVAERNERPLHAMAAK